MEKCFKRPTNNIRLELYFALLRKLQNCPNYYNSRSGHICFSMFCSLVQAGQSKLRHPVCTSKWNYCKVSGKYLWTEIVIEWTVCRQFLEGYIRVNNNVTWSTVDLVSCHIWVYSFEPLDILREICKNFEYMLTTIKF